MSVAVCPGSFDPVTNGHLDVISRASAMFGSVVIAVAANVAKRPLLTVGRRVELLQEHTAMWPNVSVAEVPGLLVDFCAEQGASVIVKGLRSGSDLDDELPMALMNRHLSGVETVFLPASQHVTHVASSLVKDIARHGGPIESLVPGSVAAAVRAALT